MAEAYGQAEALYRAQQETLASFWDSADTTILGDNDANLSMQFNLYQLFQSAGRDGLCSIAGQGPCPAKGTRGITSGIRKCT